MSTEDEDVICPYFCALRRKRYRVFFYIFDKTFHAYVSSTGLKVAREYLQSYTVYSQLRKEEIDALENVNPVHDLFSSGHVSELPLGAGANVYIELFVCEQLH